MEKITRRIVNIILLLNLFCNVINSQVFPRWFLEEERINCKIKSVGYSDTSFFRDSSVSYALKNALENLSIKDSVGVIVENMYWKTEGESYVIFSKNNQYYDSLKSVDNIKIAGIYFFKNLCIVIITDKECTIDSKMMELIDARQMKKPIWIESLPSSRDYIYAKGESKKYFYLKSSWIEAEKNARINLAKSIKLKIQSLQKKNTLEYQDIKTEDTDVILKNIEVVQRWYDPEGQLIHVLVRTKKLW